MFDWRDIHSFAVLARTGSLSAASRELGVDHATVGRRIASLERALGLRLIDRLPRRVALTEAGLAIAELGKDMEEAADAIRRRARGASVSPIATVKVSASPAVAARIIAPRVADFHRAHPGITLVLSGVPMAEALDRGEADLAIRLSRPRDPDLIARRIGVMELGLYATPAHAALPPEEWCFIAYDAPLDHLPQQAWLRTFLAGRPIVFQASDLFGQQEAARAGLGAAVLPRFMAERDASLVRLPAEPAPPARELWLAIYPDLYRSPAIRAVTAFLADVVGRECPISGGAGLAAE